VTQSLRRVPVDVTGPPPELIWPIAATRPIARHHPGLDRRGQILLHRLTVHTQTGRDLALRPARMPMDQDLCHVDHVETSPRHQAPVCTLQREQPVCYEDRTDDATHLIPVGNYVIVDLGNYVIGNRSDLGNCKIADTAERVATLDRNCR
jgi:hypothetical protein